MSKAIRRGPGIRILRFFGFLFFALFLLIAAVLIFFTVVEYKPAARETLSVYGVPSGKIQEGQDLRIMSWNIGYGALGDNADFFMDGGTMVDTADIPRIQQNMKGIQDFISQKDPDLVILQEVDRNSKRSHFVNELESMNASLLGYAGTFANNYKAFYVPYPLPPLGKVDSGLASYSRYQVESAERIQLPIPFIWPVRTINLKRALLITRMPLENSSRELVLVNLHLEAYDDGEGRAAQSAMLRDILQQEAKAGNYVIAGGDFNSCFSNVDTSAYPIPKGNWAPHIIETSDFGSGWQFLMDESVPSCRTLRYVYTGADPSTFQYYVIDGFIVSDNIQVISFEACDQHFVCSDHNPLLMEIRLKP